MATRLRIVLVTCLLVFILMDANPVLAKKGGGKFKQLEARVKELEKSVGGEDECKACQLIDEITKLLNETREETVQLAEAVSALSPAFSSIDELEKRLNEMGEEIEKLKNPPTPTHLPTTTLPPTPEIPDAQECRTYKTLDEADRKETFGDQGVVKCDDSNIMGSVPSWYRFVGAAGTKMAMSAPGERKCGTHAPGYLSGAALPTVAEGRVTRQVCFQWVGKPCNWNTNIDVRNCGPFYVYNLISPPAGCSLRYCGSD